MDPFEARLQFQQMLKTITSSNNNNILITNFLLLNQELQEDFHSCVIEALNVNELNYKINIFQLVEVVIQRSLASTDRPYIKNIVKDFDLIVTKVLSLNGENYSPLNLNSAYTILIKISKLLNFEALKDYQLKFMDISITASGKQDFEVELVPIENRLDKNEVLTKIWDLIILIKLKSKLDRKRGSDISGGDPLTSKAILRRMEDDRERTKRLKETLWEVASDTSYSNNVLKEEFNEILSKYESGKTKNDDDFKDMVELNGIVGQCYNDWGPVMKR